MDISKILNEIIKELDCTVTSFASLINFNKSFVSKVFKSEKKLSPNMLNAIIKCEKISKESKEKLQMAFLTQKYDEFDDELIIYYFNRLKGFQSYINNRSIPQTRDETLESKIFSDKMPYRIGNKTELLEIAAYFTKKLCNEENPFLYTNYLVSQTEIDLCLFSILYENEFDLDFCHILDFPKYFCKESIDVIISAFKWSTIIYNTYTKIGFQQKNETFLAPYYIITQNCVISFDKEMSCGVVYTDKSTIAFYRNEFNKIKKDFNKTIAYVEDELDLISKLNLKADKKLLSLNCYCPLEFCLDKRMLEQITNFNISNRDYFIEFVSSYCRECSCGLRHNIYTTIYAIEQFAQTGKLIFFSDKYVKPLSLDNRIKVLEKLLSLVESKKIKISILDVDKLSESESISQEFFSNITLFQYIFTDCDLKRTNKFYCSKIIINNNSIIGYNEFIDSITEYLNCGSSTLPDSSVERILKNTIIKCNQLYDLRINLL